MILLGRQFIIICSPFQFVKFKFMIFIHFESRLCVLYLGFIFSVDSISKSAHAQSLLFLIECFYNFT